MQMKKKSDRKAKPARNAGRMPHLRLLPILVLVTFLSLGVRLNSFVHDVKTVRLTPQVQAEEAAPKVEANESENETSLDAVAEEETPSEPVIEESQFLPSAIDTDMEFSQERMQIFSELSARRETLDQRERQLAQREALLKAAEHQFDSKLTELEALRAEINALLNQQSEEEKSRLQSLVKIYEGMKAKDAARIFNTLEVPVLLAVVGQMSERKSAPILAAMEPERARHLTILLAEQKQLPQLDDDMGLPSNF